MHPDQHSDAAKAWPECDIVTRAILQMGIATGALMRCQSLHTVKFPHKCQGACCVRMIKMRPWSVGLNAIMLLGCLCYLLELYIR